MTYTIKVRAGNSWLDLLDERGDVWQFDRLALAAIEAKRLVEQEGVDEARIYFDTLLAATLRPGADGKAVSFLKED